MKFRLSGPWPVGGVLIPPATVIDTEGKDDFSRHVVRAGAKVVPPVDAFPLDGEAKRVMDSAYAGYARYKT